MLPLCGRGAVPGPPHPRAGRGEGKRGLRSPGARRPCRIIGVLYSSGEGLSNGEGGKLIWLMRGYMIRV